MNNAATIPAPRAQVAEQVRWSLMLEKAALSQFGTIGYDNYLAFVRETESARPLWSQS